MKKRPVRTILLVSAAMLALLAVYFCVSTIASLDLGKINLPVQSTVLYDKDDHDALVLSGAQDRRMIALDQVPVFVRQAFIAAEDGRFYQHHGIDVKRIGGALIQDIKSRGYAQGASTITQQLVKLTHLGSEKRLIRKAREAVLALALETRMSKDEILEAYLNTVYFGAGAYGIEAASQTYFGQPASSLTLAQGALLAGIIKSPSNYAPHLNMDNALSRRESVLGAMQRLGFITAEQARDAAQETVSLARMQQEKRFAWYGQAAAEEAAAILGVSYDEILTGGYALYTGLDQTLQEQAEKLFAQKDYFPPDASDGVPVEAALVSLSGEDGAVRTLIGGRNRQVERGLDRTRNMLRQPGSAFKPVSVYAAAVDRFGYLPVSFADDTQRDFGGGYTPGNSGDKYYGTVTLREALSRSLNAATMDLLSRTGVDAAMEYAGRAGIKLPEEDRNLSMGLGSLTDGVSPMMLAAAYAPLCGSGMSVTPHIIRRIVDAQGNTLYRFQDNPRPVMRPESARLITDMLLTASSSGTAKALGSLPFSVAGKTGTVGDKQGNRDVWTAAYTPQLVTVVWMGFDRPDKTHILSGSVTGSSHPARLAAAFLEKWKSGVQDSGFTLPEGLVSVPIDSLALKEKQQAMLISDLTPAAYVQTELFPVSMAPKAVSDVWRAPSRVFDLTVQEEAGGTRVSFTAVDEWALYRVYRTQGKSSPIPADASDTGSEQTNGPGDTLLAELSGTAGDMLNCFDDGVYGAGYYVVPWEKRLLEGGIELSGRSSPVVTAGNPSSRHIAPELSPAQLQQPLF